MRRAALAIAMLVAMGASSAAAEPRPRWLAPFLAADPSAAGAHAAVLRDETAIRFARDGMRHVVRRRVVAIGDGDPQSLGAFAVMLEPGGVLATFRAWTIRGGDIAGTTGADGCVESALDRDGYVDTRTLMLAAPLPRAGDRVAFEAEWDERAPFPTYVWMPQQGRLPVTSAALHVEPPHGWAVRLHPSRVALAAPDSSTGSVDAEVRALPSVPDEPGRPADSALLPRVFVHAVRAGTGDAFGSWNALACWYAALARDASAAAACPPGLALAGDGAGAIARIASVVQDRIRYVAIELGAGRWQPRSATDTWNRRFGDCKDKASLLVSALAASGVTARPVLVCTRSRWDVDAGAPDPSQFNHCIVAIAWPDSSAPAAATVSAANGRRWTFFDPTDPTVPFGAISAELGGTWGVVADSAGGLVRLPPPTATDVRIDVAGAIRDDGTLRGDIRIVLRGPREPSLWPLFEPVDAGERESRVRAWLLAHWPHAHLESCRPARAAADSASLEFTFATGDMTRPVAGDRMLTPVFFTRDALSPPPDTARTLPLVLGAPGTIVEHWRLAIPDGWDPEPRPAAEWHGDEGDYAAAIQSQPGSITFDRRWKLRAWALQADRLPAAWPMFTAMRAGDHPSVLLRGR